MTPISHLVPPEGSEFATTARMNALAQNLAVTTTSGKQASRSNWSAVALEHPPKRLHRPPVSHRHRHAAGLLHAGGKLRRSIAVRGVQVNDATPDDECLASP